MIEHGQTQVPVVAAEEPSKSSVITFNPDQVIRAICFHLLDDNHATKISALSIHHTRDRLRRQRVSLMIARRQWETLNNRERLEWLLGKSRTQTLYSGDTASLALQK
ncbi:MAG TPA: hypothetical protein VLJ39_01935 [Tepidisphaeraceae bacterium]|jgi:hypothetical protein|nr:hypothetical protein [Tepidisphaeraceae bacterium]